LAKKEHEMNILPFKLLVLLSLLAMTLAACAPAAAIANPNTPAPVTQTTLPAETPTDVTAGGPNDATGSNLNVVTLDNNNQVFTLRAGETFLLKLGDGYDWSPVVDNPSVISRVINIAVVKGAQGIYSAHNVGIATLTATGDPVCRQEKPACMMPSIIFTLHIEVMP
jgi:hypothetical protein